jgi:hypothetical protein
MKLDPSEGTKRERNIGPHSGKIGRDEENYIVRNLIVMLSIIISVITFRRIRREGHIARLKCIQNVI